MNPRNEHMTKPTEAYCQMLCLIAGEKGRWEAWLNGCLADENPLEAITLELSTCRDDKERLGCLKRYTDGQEIDRGAGQRYLKGLLLERYRMGALDRRAVVEILNRVASELACFGEEEWTEVWRLYDLSGLSEEGIYPESVFIEAFDAFAKEETK